MLSGIIDYYKKNRKLVVNNDFSKGKIDNLPGCPLVHQRGSK